MGKEIWKDVAGYDGYYAVSNTGRVGSAKYGNWRILKPASQGNYKCVQLSASNKSRIKLAHRLVANAFLPKPHKRCEVDHKNNNKHDNRVENLQWITHQQNIIRMKRQPGNRIFTERQCAEMRKLYKKGVVQWRIAKQYKTSQQQVQRIVTRKSYK